MDDHKLIEQLQNDLESYELDTQELKRKNEELQQKISALLQKEQKSEALRSQLESLLSIGTGNDDLSKRLRALLRDFKSGDGKTGQCTNTTLLEIRFAILHANQYPPERSTKQRFNGVRTQRIE